MPRTRTRVAPVDVRQLAPQEASEEEKTALLYRPVPQLDGDPPFRVKYEWINPERASALLRKADAVEEFRQRKTMLGDIRRWKNLMNSKRFVHFFPGGTICVDPDGVMINGKHRMTAVAGLDEQQQVGFMFVYNVPRWMFAYFDTHRPRTIKDVFHIGNRVTGPQTQSAMRLAMRYEEFLYGLRSPNGWRHWNIVKDEHQDVDDFLSRREELQDWYAVGDKIHRFTKLLVPAGMVFRFYQGLAWPEGDSEITGFCESLVTGAMIAPQSPALVLREWSKDAYYEKVKVFAKRETHLMLMFRIFTQHMHGSRLPVLQWAYGMPMTMPYHPDGHEVAIKNIKSALAELDESMPR